MNGLDSIRHDYWSKVLGDPWYEYRLLPWDRSKIPVVSNTESSLQTQLIQHQVMRQLIRRGRWWYLGMGTVRSWRSVWSVRVGRALIILALYLGYQVDALFYLQAQQYKADIVQADSFVSEDVSVVTTLLWPWGLEDVVDDVVERHDRQMYLHYLAGTMSWTIPKYERENVYSWSNIFRDASLSYPVSYYSNQRLLELEGQLEQSLLLRDMVKDMEKRAQQIGWELKEPGPYLEQERIERLYEQVKESEVLHPIVQELIQRGKAINWDISTLIERRPYQQLNVTELERQMMDSERLNDTVQELKGLLDCNSLSSDVQKWITPPYSDANLEKLYSRIQNGTACYTPPTYSSGSGSSAGRGNGFLDVVKDAANVAKDAAKDAAKAGLKYIKSRF